MRFTKITGTFVKIDSGQRIDVGVSYASQELKLDQHKIIVRTFGHGKQIETHFSLQGADFLDFVATSDDPKIPNMNGHFFNSDYEECILRADLNDQKANVHGVVTKLDATRGLSVKTITSSVSGNVVGVLQEWIELISEDAFKLATSA